MEIFFEAFIKLLVIGVILAAIICPNKLKSAGSTVKSDTIIANNNKKIHEKRSEMIDIISWSLLAEKGEKHKTITNLSFTSYADIVKLLGYKVNAIRELFASIKKENVELARNNRNRDQSIAIANMEYEVLNDIRSLEENFKIYVNKINAFPRKSKLVNDNNYGTVNQTFLDASRNLEKNSVEKYAASCYRVLSAKSIEGIYQIDVESLMKCLWFFAAEEKFNSEAFTTTKKAFTKVYKNSHPDAILAEFYAYRKIGTDGILRETLRQAFARSLSGDDLIAIASGLKWMGEYNCEREILRYAETNGFLSRNGAAISRLKQLNGRR